MTKLTPNQAATLANLMDQIGVWANDVSPLPNKLTVIIRFEDKDQDDFMISGDSLDELTNFFLDALNPAATMLPVDQSAGDVKKRYN